MKFTYPFLGENEMTVKEFLKQKKLPRNFIKEVKMSGDIRLNGQHVTVRALLKPNDVLELIAPDEQAHETVRVSNVPIEIVYEDADVLIVNKPSGVVSIPSRFDPDTSIANRVKGYYVRQGYKDQVVHIVTRLDKDTTGLMIIAKHRLAHALIDRQIRHRTMDKIYHCITFKTDWPEHGVVEAPIGRQSDSIITREVREDGQYAKTEYWLMQQLQDSALMRIKLHTGRTHQIRVHMAYLGGVLVGDDLYGGQKVLPILRQALHCSELSFRHPMTDELLQIKLDLPDDMAQWVSARQII